MPETEDLYEILHLHPSAHPDVIQAAYRRLALLYHPDKNSTPEATEMMAAVNRAYEVLSDPEKRAEYDRRRAGRKQRRSTPATSAKATDSVGRRTLSGLSTQTEFVTLDEGRYIVTATVRANSPNGYIGFFAISIESILVDENYRSQQSIQSWVTTEGSYSYLIRVGSRHIPYYEIDLFSGRQIVTVEAEGSWTVDFELVQ